MYQINRRTPQIMRFQLGEKEVSFRLPEHLTPEKLNAASGALVKAREIEDQAASFKAVGEAVIGILRLVFGNDLADEIIAFFEGDYVEMVEQVFPYINYEVLPTMARRSKERAKKLKVK